MGLRHLLLVLALLAALTAVAPQAAAHTQVQRATPGPGESVEGEVSSVELDFLDPVAPTPTIEVTGPDGAPVAGLADVRLVADDVARVSFDALTVAGDYRVDYSFIAADGAAQEGAHQFGFQPSEGVEVELRTVLAWVVLGVVGAFVAAAVIGRRRATT